MAKVPEFKTWKLDKVLGHPWLDVEAELSWDLISMKERKKEKRGGEKEGSKQARKQLTHLVDHGIRTNN